MLSGQVIEVNVTQLGDELAAATIIGATSLTVVDAADFSELGGSLVIGSVTGTPGEIAHYSTVDDETGIVTLVAPLTVAHAVGERVDVPGTEATALVVVDEDEEALAAEVPFHLRNLLPEGIRVPGEGEPVVVRRQHGWGWVVTDVMGLSPGITTSRPIRIEGADGTLGQWDESGGVTGTYADLDGAGDGTGVSIYGMDFAEHISGRAAGTVAYGSLTPTNTAVTTEVGIYELAVETQANRGYLLSSYFAMTGATANSQLTYRIRDGGASAPTTASTIVRTYRWNIPYVGRNMTGTDAYAWFPAAGVHRLLATVSSTASADTVGEWGMSVLDTGPVPINTAVVFGGASVRAFTSMWECNGVYTRSVGDTSSVVTIYGYQESNLMSAFKFTANAVEGETAKTIQTALSGATITKLEFGLTNVDWDGSSQGTAQLGVHTATALPALTDAQVTLHSKAVSDWAAGATKWVTMPTGLHAAFVSGVTRGFVIGPRLVGSVSSRWRGDAADKPPKIRITYTR